MYLILRQVAMHSLSSHTNTVVPNTTHVKYACLLILESNIMSCLYVLSQNATNKAALSSLSQSYADEL